MSHKQYDELELRDDFMFGKVMSNKELCRKTLEILLDTTIEDIEYPDVQKTLNITVEGRSVRLDMYVADEKEVIYNGEMQQYTAKAKEELPQRSRYYQGMIDLNLLEKGVVFSKLNECYVIFICTFDPFGLGRCRYTFQNTCKEEPGLYLKDLTTKIFLNTKGNRTEDISSELAAFLDYVETLNATDDFTRELELEIGRIKQNVEWRREYMKTLLHEREIREEAREEGREEGRQEGRQEGRNDGQREQLQKNILSMLEKGMKVEDIAFYLDVSLEDVQRIEADSKE